MDRMSVETVCNLKMIKAEYRYIVPNEGSPYYGYRIAVNQNGETIAQFDVPQGTASELANELNSLGALIIAHTRHRQSD